MRKLKTLKDVVARNNPECINPHIYVKKCPSNYDYLKDHYTGTCEQFVNCEDCWNQPYIPFDDVKTEREKIIEALQTMKQICVEERNTKKRLDCNGCRLFDICSRIDDAFDGSEFFAWDIENLPEK